MQNYHILTDEDVANYLTMREAITYMEGAFREQANGTLVAPPRFAVKAPKGRMVFTAGAATGLEHGRVGEWESGRVGEWESGR
ncbi:MAG: hypothetical protein ACPGWR_26290, partial [Ardenticatenaceae bacterium]